MLNDELYVDYEDTTANENEWTGMETSATAEFASQTAPQLCHAATQTECYTREVTTTSTLTLRWKIMKDKSNQTRPKNNNSFSKVICSIPFTKESSQVSLETSFPEILTSALSILFCSSSLPTILCRGQRPWHRGCINEI